MSETLVRMPKLADTLVEGTLGQWLKRVGDAVRQGEPLASIETDKVTTELTSPAAGTLLEVLVSDGQTVPIETPIARIGEAVSAETPIARSGTPVSGETPIARSGKLVSAEASFPQIGEAVSAEAPRGDAPTPLAEPPSARKKTTPVAARLLAEHGLKPEDIATATRSGRLTKDDVLRFIRPQPPGAPARGPDGNLVRLTSMRRAIAEHMLAARQTIPHGHAVMQADLTQVVGWRESCRSAFLEQQGASLTFTVLFVYALARRLAVDADGPADLGVAVAFDGGLIVPVVRRADSLNLAETARAVADLAARARAGKLAPGETQGARMTLTNVGSFGNLTALPIVPLGQIGILGPGLVEPRPLAAPNGGIQPGWSCLVSLSFDRRAFTDFAADRFLRGVVDDLTAIPAAARI
jgi:2-oxoisovalerate dehydrogenase E2 component (dihydrolipoyl transacylase)